MFFYTCTTSCSCLSTWYELFNHLVYKLIFTYICMWGMFDITQFSAIITKVWWEMFRSKHLLQHTILYNDFSISYCAESFGGKCRYRFSCTHIKNPYWNFSLDEWYKYRNFFSSYICCTIVCSWPEPLLSKFSTTKLKVELLR